MHEMGMKPSHMNGPAATLTEPLVTELTLVPFYLEVDIPDVHVQTYKRAVTVRTDTATSGVPPTSWLVVIWVLACELGKFYDGMR